MGKSMIGEWGNEKLQGPTSKLQRNFNGKEFAWLDSFVNLTAKVVNQ